MRGSERAAWRLAVAACVLLAASCAAQPENTGPAAPSATVFEGARLITGDGGGTD